MADPNETRRGMAAERAWAALHASAREYGIPETVNLRESSREHLALEIAHLLMDLHFLANDLEIGWDDLLAWASGLRSPVR